ncbi:Rrf2 family protein [Chitinophaga terrae (ex Kim and Jung 2007)]|jgi:Rrf2 family protein|uniref:Rrf2 family protein n=1 Tax=Chitinophaga terrae (ex Kim and Jung 2007) TaxID=408074 RepID=A0A1H3WTS7_9BACT|nr:Rrf2 family transcriptional regulator [Chitinophaga terrae (ex Kim and Jung 2007)]MDQ0107081.1 Rrf2 family protein [Chitinophaga terrae (ex Kim and Jung 2007)]GEP90327.1 Rrf2 family transcriptional regulator [Chitinophaga terrae (ex Kim and Jung 2007)]SDZ90370.1 Rrf2 family protein [Chitinophaga terrae (ex Kim and Jung 2007)]
MNNGRFPISLHILTLLASDDNGLKSSDYLAGSININPVLVRKELSNLRKHGIIESKEGKNGGATLARPAGKILLSEVYHAVQQSSLLGNSKNKPNPECPIGRQINQHLDNLYDELEGVLLQKLADMTLEDFVKQFDNKD